MNRKAEDLFSSKEEAITFTEDYGFSEAHIELLHTSGMIFESAKVLADGGRISDAVKTLITTPRAQDRVRCAVEYLLSGLWQHQSFGTDHPTTNPEVVSELLGLADTLKNGMHEAEAREVAVFIIFLYFDTNSVITQIAMFRARHTADFKTLRDLYPKFVRAKNHSAALMCLDSTFTSTLPRQGVPTIDSSPELLLHFTYFELLDRLRREDSLDTGSIRQKVFAFQPREDEDDRFFIPANNFLHVVFISKPDTAQEKGGCVVTHEELRRVLDYEIPEYTRLRAKQQNNAYRKRLGVPPCLTMVAKGGCPKPDCQLQHIRPEKITADWFNTRIRLVLMEIQILNLAGFYPTGVILCVFYTGRRPELHQILTV